MPNKINMIGYKSGRLTVVSEAYNKNGRYYWNCICECGNNVTVAGTHLRNGNTKSCGCLQVDRVRELKTTHGLSHTTEHNSWIGMVQRCRDKNHFAYKYYGGKGIMVCERWNNSFQNFLDDMGKKPTPKHTIERIDSNIGYSMDNCRWATMAEQNLNKSDNHFLTFNGKRQTIKEWSDEVGIHYDTIRHRINTYGWSVDRALTEIPINYKNKEKQKQ